MPFTTTTTRRRALRGAAALQFALAFVCTFYALVFLLSPPGHDELGLSQSFDPAFMLSFAGAAALFATGGLRAWRAAARWWLPALIAIVAAPLLVVVLALVFGARS